MPRFLVVEDDDIICEIVCEELRDEFGGIIECAHTCQRAGNRLRAAQFDLAVIDVYLGGCSAMPLVGIAANENTPVLLTTGDPDARNLLQAFGYPHVMKPYDLKRLVEEASAIIRDKAENVRQIALALAKMQASSAALQAGMADAERTLKVARTLVTRTTSNPFLPDPS